MDFAASPMSACREGRIVMSCHAAVISWVQQSSRHYGV
jgi:hypothetical protein